MGVPGSGKPTDVDGGKSNNQTQKKTYYDYWQRGRPLALAVGLEHWLYLGTKKVCRTGSGPEGKPIRSQTRISL